MPNDSNTAMQLFNLMLKLGREIREAIRDTVDIIGEIVKSTGNEAKEVMNNRKEVKLQKEANKGGEIALDKLQKNHKEVVSEVIQPENLNSFKRFANEFNLQYSTSKEDNGKIKIHYGADHQGRFNTTVDSLVRSINFKQNEVNPKELNNNELIVAIKDLREEIKGLNNKIEKLEEKIADLEGKNKALENQNIALKRENKDLSKENIRFIDRPDSKTVNKLDDLIKGATDRSSKNNEALKENKMELGMHNRKLSMER